MNQYEDWVGTQYVEARYGGVPQMPGFHARGKVVSYSIEPQVLIEAPDGQQTWWRADMCVPVDAPSSWVDEVAQKLQEDSS